METALQAVGVFPIPWERCGAVPGAIFIKDPLLLVNPFTLLDAIKRNSSKVGAPKRADRPLSPSDILLVPIRIGVAP